MSSARQRYGATLLAPPSTLHGGKGIAGVWALSSLGTAHRTFAAGHVFVAVAITKFVWWARLPPPSAFPSPLVRSFPYSSPGLKFCMAMIGITVVWAHRANIKKLMTGKESKLVYQARHRARR